MLKTPIIIFIQLTLFGSFSLSGQEPLVIGAEWHYNLYFFGKSDIGYNRCYIEGDTIIQDRKCLIYIQEVTTCNGRPERNFLYKDSDKIYFFDEDDATFKLLYDFSLEVGDTMVYETGIHSWDLKRRTHYILVDSVGTFTANENEVKRFVVSYGWRDENDRITFGQTKTVIIEDIGSTNNFFHFSDGTGFCDDKYSDTLRCFSTPDYPLVRFTNTDCLFTPVYDIKHDYNIDVYPNPFNGELYLDSPTEMTDTDIVIYDLTGSEIYRGHWYSGSTRTSLQMYGFKPSCYLFTLINSKTNQIFYRQIIIKTE